MSLFQPNLRKQIRNLPKILNFVKNSLFNSELFTSLLRPHRRKPQEPATDAEPPPPAPCGGETPRRPVLGAVRQLRHAKNVLLWRICTPLHRSNFRKSANCSMKEVFSSEMRFKCSLLHAQRVGDAIRHTLLQEKTFSFKFAVLCDRI